MKKNFIVRLAPKSDVKRKHSTGECFKNDKHKFILEVIKVNNE